MMENWAVIHGSELAPVGSNESLSTSSHFRWCQMTCKRLILLSQVSRELGSYCISVLSMSRITCVRYS